MNMLLLMGALLSTPDMSVACGENYYNECGQVDREYARERRENRARRACREGDRRYFQNDGYCSNGMNRNTHRVCRGGKYVIVRQECYNGR